MRIFVTGASGFIGGHAVETLSARHAVTAMARSEKSAAAVRALGATPVRCELGAVRPEHLEGVDAIIHCAAYAEEWGTREQFWSANVEGTSQLLDAARAAGVRRFVHVGTEAALFDGADLLGVDESRPYPARHRFLYPETKAEAERRVLAASEPGRFETISIRPRLVWGPRDASVLAAIVRMAEDGSWAWLDGGRARTSTSYVANVVHALELALTRGTSGRAYFVADDGERSIREFIEAYALAAGVTLPSRSVPSMVARPLSALIEGTYRLFGIRRKPPMTAFAVAMMSASVTVRDDAARRELGYAPIIGVEEGMRLVREARGATSDRRDHRNAGHASAA